MWPITMENFEELNIHLGEKLSKIHAGHHWQMICYYFKEIKREQEEWRQLEEMERDAMEAYQRIMTTHVEH